MSAPILYRGWAAVAQVALLVVSPPAFGGSMAGVEQPILLPSIEAYIVERHGSPRGLSADEIELLGELADGIVEQIADGWPVDTSTSRDTWEAFVEEDPLGFTIVNDTDYVEWVHLAGTDPEPPLWETLIPDVWEANRDAVVDAMRRAIDITEADIVAARAEGIGERAVLSGRYRSSGRAA